MPWINLPADDATIWTSVDFLNQFVEAFNERISLIDPLRLYTSGEFPGEFVVGGLVVGVGHAGEGVYGLQLHLESAVPLFGDPSLFPIGSQAFINEFGSSFGPSVGTYDLPTWRVASGIPVDGFTRKYPREIATPSSSGSAGQRARSLDDVKMYEHDGSEWSLSANQASPPDTITAYGLMQVGDYVGPWIFNELQAGIQALHTIRVPTVSTFLADANPSLGDPREEYSASHLGSYFPEADADDAIADAYAGAAADWSFGVTGLDASCEISFNKVLPDRIVGSVREERYRCSAHLTNVKLEWFRIPDNLTRDVTGIFFWPGDLFRSDGLPFYDFGTGMIDGWNDLTGKIDPEVPTSGEQWATSSQWPFDSDQTVIPANPHSLFGGFPGDLEQGQYAMSYESAKISRAVWAGYVRFSGFEYP